MSSTITTAGPHGLQVGDITAHGPIRHVDAEEEVRLIGQCVEMLQQLPNARSQWRALSYLCDRFGCMPPLGLQRPART